MSDEIWVHVHLLSGRSTDVCVSSTETMEDLWSEVARKLDAQPPQLSLFYGTQVLKLSTDPIRTFLDVSSDEDLELGAAIREEESMDWSDDDEEFYYDDVNDYLAATFMPADVEVDDFCYWQTPCEQDERQPLACIDDWVCECECERNCHEDSVEPIDAPEDAPHNFADFAVCMGCRPAKGSA